MATTKFSVAAYTLCYLRKIGPWESQGRWRRTNVAFGALRGREILAGVGILAAGAGLLATLFYRELDTILETASSEARTTL